MNRGCIGPLARSRPRRHPTEALDALLVIVLLSSYSSETSSDGFGMTRMEIIMAGTTQTGSAALLAMRRIFDEGFATGETAVVDEVCSPDLVEHQFGMAGVGSDAVEHVKAAIRDVHRAFPDV